MATTLAEVAVLSVAALPDGPHGCVGSGGTAAAVPPLPQLQLLFFLAAACPLLQAHNYKRIKTIDAGDILQFTGGTHDLGNPIGSTSLIVRSQVRRLLCLIALIPLVVADCRCSSIIEDRNRSQALKHKLTALALILVAGTIGVCLPILGKTIPALHPERSIFFIIRGFTAGLILSTGFVHILSDAFVSLTSPCLSETPLGHFPFAGFVAMLAALGTLMVDTVATSYYMKLHADKARENQGHVHVHTHATHGHSHGSISAGSDLVRHRVRSQVLLMGILMHSRIIGISLGASESPSIIRTLVAALTLYQFFEGIGLGARITQAKFKTRAIVIMALFYSLTTPAGIAIGLGVSNVYDETGPTALIVGGISNAASSGILIYMALVDLLAADFMSPKLQNNRRLLFGTNMALLLGTVCMCLLAKWT